MGFTDNQKHAVFDPGNIIVSAGAGSGKTTVMIARIIDKLKKGEAKDLSEMLIVTFTRASAADMRVKLTEKLYELKSEKEYEKTAIAALDSLPTANIGTLHSYCQRLVKTYFFAAGIDPSAVICEEGEADGIRSDVVESAVDRAWANATPCFSVMYDVLSTRRSDDAVKDVVGEILEFALSMPDPKGYLSSVSPDSESFAELDGIVGARVAEFKRRVAGIRLDLDAAGMQDRADMCDEMIDYLDGKLDELSKASNWTKTLDYRDELNARVLDMKGECKKLREFCALAAKAKTVDGSEYAAALKAVALDAYDGYREKKERLGKIDYSDLEHGAYAVLCDEQCLGEIARTLKYVFIDEFQDVNPLQSAIADRLKAAGAEMFLVGDVKQSIYGFRRCSPDHFIKAIADPDYRHIPLSDNFRSTQTVIDFINKVFDGTMTTDFGGVDYKSPEQRLVYGNKTLTGGDAGLYLVPVEKKQKASTAWKNERDLTGYSVVADSKSEKTDGEAKLIADMIVDYADKHKDIPLGKIAVLTRSLGTRFCAALESELKLRGVKYVMGKRGKAKDCPDVVALVDIMRCVDNRYDDIALYTAMRSALGGFTDGELMDIALIGEKNALNSGALPIFEGKHGYALWQKATAYRGALEQKIQAFLAVRDEIARAALTCDCADVLGIITAKTDYFTHVYERGGNAEAVEVLISFAADRELNVHEFLNYYDGTDFELKAGMTDDAVNITTIHASKGLEYELVIVADTAKRFNETDRYKKVSVSERGVFVKLPDPMTRELIPTAPWLVENVRYPDRARAEELRLLYVALTRAKNTLAVTGKSNGIKQKEPRDCGNILGVFYGIPTQPVALTPREVGEEEPPIAQNSELENAIRAAHRKAADYNADRQRLTVIPIKTCVTAAAHKAAEDEETPTVMPVITHDYAEDGDKDDVDARVRGTAYHRAMELMDFSHPDLDMLEQTCDNFNLVDKAEILRAAAVMRPLTEGAAFVAKERYFIVNLPANEVYGEQAQGEVLVQGVIDLLIVNKDGTATIIDYKTGNPSHLNNVAYKTQLRLYTEAVERTTPLKVKRAVLYSFESGEIMDIQDKVRTCISKPN